MKLPRRKLLVRGLALGTAGLALSLGLSTAALADWQPQKPIEFVVMAGKGGGADKAVRFFQSIIAKHNREICMSCLTCFRVCPFGSPYIDDDGHVTVEAAGQWTHADREQNLRRRECPKDRWPPDARSGDAMSAEDSLR